ncbi:MAG: hypothetical protein ACKPFJ_09085, partial [Dolichospermum sp.]
FSSTNGLEIKTGINMPEHFANQVISQVDFISLVENMTAKCDLMVEVGSGRVLSGLVSNIPNSCQCFPLESKPGNDSDLNSFLAYYFVNGGSIKWSELYKNRLVRSFIPAAEKIFIENPCEGNFNVAIDHENPEQIPEQILDKKVDFLTESSQLSINGQELETLLSSYVRERGAFLAELIKADLESLPFF